MKKSALLIIFKFILKHGEGVAEYFVDKESNVDSKFPNRFDLAPIVIEKISIFRLKFNPHEKGITIFMDFFSVDYNNKFSATFNN